MGSELSNTHNLPGSHRGDVLGNSLPDDDLSDGDEWRYDEELEAFVDKALETVNDTE